MEILNVKKARMVDLTSTYWDLVISCSKEQGVDEVRGVFLKPE